MWTGLRYLSFLIACVVVHAHPHHDKIDEEDLNAPIDATLYIHIGLQTLTWGFLFPAGMVLGMTR